MRSCITGAWWTGSARRRRAHRYVNNVAGNLAGVSLMLRAMTGLRKTDLHTLFDLHVRARGTRVADVAQAETVFSVDAGITPRDLERIAAEFM